MPRPPAHFEFRNEVHLHHPMPTAAGTPTGRFFFAPDRFQPNPYGYKYYLEQTPREIPEPANHRRRANCRIFRDLTFR